MCIVTNAIGEHLIGAHIGNYLEWFMIRIKMRGFVVMGFCDNNGTVISSERDSTENINVEVGYAVYF